uniref:Ras association domain family member 4 n=1 Tax=Sus scrofa TaxID=9823 RepID=A0A8D0W9M8_PIG
MKEDCPPSSHVPISDSKSILKSELLSLLKTYNCYHEGRSFQLRHREEEGALIIEGLLNISWGLRRPIRLQIQDDRERVHLSSASWTPGRSSFHPKEPSLQDGKVTAQEPSTQAKHTEESSKDGSEPLEEDEETPQLMRTKSDAACVIQRRPRCRAPGEAQRIRRHRFSINGHFYNHKVTPQLGLSPGGPEATATGNQHLTQVQLLGPQQVGPHGQARKHSHAQVLMDKLAQEKCLAQSHTGMFQFITSSWLVFFPPHTHCQFILPSCMDIWKVMPDSSLIRQFSMRFPPSLVDRFMGTSCPLLSFSLGILSHLG